MLHYALVFLILALVAGVLGFGGIAGMSASIAWILFLGGLAVFVASALISALRRPHHG